MIVRLFWIIVGIVALVWLGFLHFDRNEIRLDLDETNHRIDGVEQRFNNGNPAPQKELNVGEEIQDETQDAKEEVQQGIPTKEEQHLDEGKDELEEAKEEQLEKDRPRKELNQQPKDVETSLPQEPTSMSEAVEGEAIVAFNLEFSDDVSHAFKLYDTPTFEDREIVETFLNLDPMILSLR